MGRTRWGSVTGALALGLVGGCAQEELPGHHFALAFAQTDDACNDPDVTYKEAIDYRLIVEGTAVTLYVDESPLGTGALAGCELQYRSNLFTDEREDGTVRWSIDGAATISLGDGCDAGDGWVGQEVIEISSSTDPAIARGCTFTMSVEGSYLGETP